MYLTEKTGHRQVIQNHRQILNFDAFPKIKLLLVFRMKFKINLFASRMKQTRLQDGKGQRKKSCISYAAYSLLKVHFVILTCYLYDIVQ